MMATLIDLRDPADHIEKMRLCNKGIAQGWGRFVPPLVPKIVRQMPVVSRTNYLTAPQVESGDAATVSKTETVGGGKGRGKKK